MLLATGFFLRNKCTTIYPSVPQMCAFNLRPCVVCLALPSYIWRYMMLFFSSAAPLRRALLPIGLTQLNRSCFSELFGTFCTNLRRQYGKMRPSQTPRTVVWLLFRRIQQIMLSIKEMKKCFFLQVKRNMRWICSSEGSCCVLQLQTFSGRLSPMPCVT